MAELLGGEDEPEYQNPEQYEIEEEIGRGGDGIVYLCRDKNVGRLVAIKFLNFLRTPDQSALQRFRSEIETIASLDHPHIIPIYANGEKDGRSFYTMKYLGGGSLADRLGNPMATRDAVEVMSKITDAVNHAHERGVLHRDLKPSNVLLDDRGQPCLSDFGLAKRHSTTSQLTITGSVMGTPAYMSPEQARGETTKITTSSDLFSLGSLFYFLLTGEHAFQGEDSHVLLRRVIDDDPTFPDLDRDLVAICRKCLEKNPAHRYPDTRALLEDLHRWQNDEPVSARHLTVTRRAGRLARRHPTAFIATGLAIIAVFLSLRDRPSEPPASKPTAILESEDDYLSRLEQSLNKLRQLNYHESNRLLDNAPAPHRDFEWKVAKALAQGDEIWRVDLTDKNPKRIFLSAREVILATSSDEYFRISAKGGSLEKIASPPIPNPLVSPDQNWTATYSESEARIFRTGDKFPTFEFGDFAMPVHAVQFSTDSQYVMVQLSSETSAFHVYDLNSGKITIDQALNTPASATPNFDNSSMTLFGDFPYFITWNYRAVNNMRQFGLFPEKGLFRRETYRGDGSYFFGHFPEATHLVSLPDGSGSLSLHTDNTLRRWPPARSLPGIDDSLAVDVGEGPPALSNSGRYVFFRNYYQQPELHDYETARSFLLPIQQSPLVVLNDGTFISVVEETGQLITRRFDGIEEATWLWNANTNLPGRPDQRVIQTAVTPDEHFAVVLFASGFLKIDLHNQNATFTPTESIASAIAISPDGRRVVTSGMKTTLHQGDESITLQTGDNQHRLCHFRSNEELLITDNGGFLHSLNPKNPISFHSRDLGSITALATTLDGRFTLTGGDERIILWRGDQKRLEIPTDSSPFWLQLCDHDRILFHLNQMGTIERLILTTP